jgi:hypothetical protein
LTRARLALGFAQRVAVLDRIALVVDLLAAPETQFELRHPVLK